MSSVGGVHRCQIAVDAFFDLLHPGAQLAVGEVAITVVDRFELAAVDGHLRLGEQIELATQHDELPADIANGFAVVTPEVGNGFEVRSQSPGQPHQLEVALAFALQATAGLNAVEVAVDVDLQHHGRVIGRSPSYGRSDPIELQSRQIELLDEGFDHTDRVVFGDEVIQAFGKQADLRPARLFDESLHTPSPLTLLRQL